MSVVTDKLEAGVYPNNLFLNFLSKRKFCYSLEASRQDASNDYPQQILFMYSKKTMIVFGETISHLGL